MAKTAEQRRVESARSTGIRAGTFVRYARPDNGGTLNMDEQELGERFQKDRGLVICIVLVKTVVMVGLERSTPLGKNGKNNHSLGETRMV